MVLSLLYFLVIGLLAGYLASRLMGLHSNDIGMNLLTGTIGSFVGGFVGRLIGLQATGMIGSIIMAVIGSCIAIWAYRKFILK